MNEDESDIGVWNLQPDDPRTWWLGMQRKPDEELIADMLEAERNGGGPSLNIFYLILKPRLEKSNPEKLKQIGMQLAKIFNERMSRAKQENEITARTGVFEKNMPDTLDDIIEYFRSGRGSPG